MQAYFFVPSSAALEHGMFAVNGLITAASDCIIRELRQRNKLTAFTLQSKQLAGVCAWSVTHQHLHLIGFSWPSSPIDQTMTSKVIVAADIRSQRGWNSRDLKRLRMACRGAGGACICARFQPQVPGAAATLRGASRSLQMTDTSTLQRHV